MYSATFSDRLKNVMIQMNIKDISKDFSFALKSTYFSLEDLSEKIKFILVLMRHTFMGKRELSKCNLHTSHKPLSELLEFSKDRSTCINLYIYLHIFIFPIYTLIVGLLTGLNHYGHLFKTRAKLTILCI